jgi:hypothetical protein
MANNNLKQNKVQEILKLDNRINSIRQLTRLRDRENQELTFLASKAKKCQNEVKHLDNKIIQEKLYISKLNKSLLNIKLNHNNILLLLSSVHSRHRNQCSRRNYK